MTAHVMPAAGNAVMARAAAPRPARAPARVVTGRMVQARLSNGKVVTYNCSLAGNATKTACRA